MKKQATVETIVESWKAKGLPENIASGKYGARDIRMMYSCSGTEARKALGALTYKPELRRWFLI